MVKVAVLPAATVSEAGVTVKSALSEMISAFSSASPVLLTVMSCEALAVTRPKATAVMSTLMMGAGTFKVLVR